MPLTNEEKLEQYLTFFNRGAKIEHEGKFYTPTEEDFNALNSGGTNYWHHKTDPSSWLTCSTVSYYRRKYGEELPRDKVIDLCAQALNTSSAEVERLLDWNARYVAFHDGMTPEETHTWPQEEETKGDVDVNSLPSSR